jgi:cytochrome c oxidase assembly factor CtaG/cytochrome c551/c552
MTTAITLVALALLAALYSSAMRAHSGVRAFSRPRIIAFAVGWLTAAAALVWPLHELAEQRLSAHMVQHELLILIAVPLLAFARLDLALLVCLRGHGRQVTSRLLGKLRVSMPVAWALHAVALWVWHLPVLYQTAGDQPLLHLAQHASFGGTAYLFWLAAFDRRTGYGAAALYVFLTSLHSGLLGVLLFLSPRLWYPHYALAQGALEDQQLAGLIMWIPGGVALTITAIWLLWRWLNDTEPSAAARRLPSSVPEAARTLTLVVLISAAALLLPACDDAKQTAIALTGGNPDSGKAAIRKYGCWTCHTIPGVYGANAVVGPPLDKLANRAYVAGYPNKPAHLIAWIRHPQSVRNPTPMPDMGITEADARDIAAYLYTLR